jgi:hypothetical protein
LLTFKKTTPQFYEKLLAMKSLINPVCIAFLFPFYVFAQNSHPPLDSIAGQLINNLRSRSPEKIVMQTDKSVYSAGETIWFRAYILDSLSNRLKDRSKILYVDLVNDKDSVEQQLLFDAGHFQTNGSVSLDDSLQTGYYWVRAYTKKILEQNVNNIGLLPLYVFNIHNNNPQQRKVQRKNEAVQTDAVPIVDIYPEGGELISGIDCVVALRVHDKKGNPLSVAGYVKNSKGDIDAKFSTDKNGLAKFSFSPVWYRKYGIFIQNHDRYDSIAALPRVNLYAAQIAVVQQNNSFIKARVMLEDSIFTLSYTTYILGVHDDQLCFAGVGKGRYELDIPVSKFPGGISELLLFNPQGKLVSERDIYIDKKSVAVNITNDKQNYDAREKVKMNIKVTDDLNQPLVSALSVSVAASRVTDSTNSFYKDEFLNGFDFDSPARDLEMLTRKDATHILNSMSIDTNYSSENLVLNGKVLDKKNIPIPQAEVMLMIKGDNTFILQDTTQTKGDFHFDLPFYKDMTEFSIQTNNMMGKKEEYQITTDPLIFPRFKTPLALKEKFDNGREEFLETIKRKYIDPVIIEAGKNSLPLVTVTASEKKTKNAKVNEDLSNVITQKELMEGGSNNVERAVLSNGKFHLLGGYLMAGGPNGLTGPSATDEPIIIMDGQQITVSSDGITGSPVLSFLKELTPSDIGYIKILTPEQSGMYGLRGGHGVIEIHSTTIYDNNISKEGIVNFYRKGFTVPSNFPMPDYDDRQTRKSKTPDVRTTIYWNGNIITDKNGEITLTFYSADASETYIVTIAGVTEDGEKIYKTTTIERN